MPTISAFRGIRYDLGHVGSLSDVIAPPYDVIDPALQDELYKKHPANVVRLILNRDEPGDDEHSNRYTRAARFLRNWLREGVLFTEADPAIYVYHQEFVERGADVHPPRLHVPDAAREVRRGEHLPPRRDARRRQGRSAQAVEGVHAPTSARSSGSIPIPRTKPSRSSKPRSSAQTPLEATDHLGAIHRIWPVTDISIINQVSALLAGKPVYIADGHHRYETACNLRDDLAAELKERGEELSPEHPANFVLMMCVSMSDPGMLVLPTHRLFRGLPAMTAERAEDEARRRLRHGTGRQRPRSARSRCGRRSKWKATRRRSASTPPKDDQWTLGPPHRRRPRADGGDLGRSLRGLARARREHPAPPGDGHAPRACRLLPAPKYVRDARGSPRRPRAKATPPAATLTGQDGSGGRFELAALVMPATVEHIRAISNAGERMPAKSTFFFPKLLSGLVINPLE